MKTLTCFLSLLFLAAIAYGQRPVTPANTGQPGNAITKQQKETVTCFMHLKPTRRGFYGGYGRQSNIIGFVIHNIDTAGESNWVSPLITSYEKDNQEYLVKVDIPRAVLGNTTEAWCEAYIDKDGDTSINKYGGVVLSNIKLFLKSTPEGAETFLIPNRVWTKKIENTNWESNNSIIENYRVNTASTNTFAYVDETVYVVLYKYKNAYKKIIHFTKPVTIEREQTAWVQF